MSELAIRAENLGKRYERFQPRSKWLQRIGLTRLPMGGYGVHALEGDQLPPEFWALKQVSFEIRQGEVVGIVGRNGAGKSTLLKLLSRITEPTTGRAEIYGRVGSLLEVGTGFHPDLTGRENVYLNGAFLGMSRASVQKRFDEIVAFAEVEDFIDSPVKHYSSGMYVRLAFSVAAHLEPEILILDEVLGVGDASFQIKSHHKMHSLVNEEGRTVIFVSHNMIALEALCDSGVYLEHGQTVCAGPIGEVLETYGYQRPAAQLPRVMHWEGRAGDEESEVRLLRTWIRSAQGGENMFANAGMEVGVEMELLAGLDNLALGFWLVSDQGYNLAFTEHDGLQGEETHRTGKLRKCFHIPADFLAEGDYRIEFALWKRGGKPIVHRNAATLHFTVLPAAEAAPHAPSPHDPVRRSLLTPPWSA